MVDNTICHELLHQFCQPVKSLETTTERTYDQPGCEFQTTEAGKGMHLLDVHKLSAHNIPSPYNYCLVGECTYRTKIKNDLKKHQRREGARAKRAQKRFRSYR